MPAASQPQPRPGGSPATGSKQKDPSFTGAPRATQHDHIIREMRRFPPNRALPASPAQHRWTQRAGSILSFSCRLQLGQQLYLLFIAKKLLLFLVCPNSCKKSFPVLSPRRGSTGTGCIRCHKLHGQVGSCMLRQVCLQSIFLAIGQLRGASRSPHIAAASSEGCSGGRSVPEARGQLAAG